MREMHAPCVVTPCAPLTLSKQAAPDAHSCATHSLARSITLACLLGRNSQLFLSALGGRRTCFPSSGAIPADTLCRGRRRERENRSLAGTRDLRISCRIPHPGNQEGSQDSSFSWRSGAARVRKACHAAVIFLRRDLCHKHVILVPSFLVSETTGMRQACMHVQSSESESQRETA